MLLFRTISLITGFLFILFTHAFAQWEAQDPGFPEGIEGSWRSSEVHLESPQGDAEDFAPDGDA